MNQACPACEHAEAADAVERWLVDAYDERSDLDYLSLKRTLADEYDCQLPLTAVKRHVREHVALVFVGDREDIDGEVTAVTTGGER